MADEHRSFDRKAVQANRAGVQDVGAQPSPQVEGPGEHLDDRNAAGLGDAGDLGAGTPANVDVHKLGQTDRPQEAWGEPAGEAATFSSNNSRKGLHADGDAGQGAKTRRLNKDTVSRRL
jgi:hypothetical protein